MTSPDPSAARPAGYFLQRLLLATLPPLLALAGLDRAMAAQVYDRDEALYDLVADPAVPLPELVLGPSNAAHGIDPAALGPGYWNLGIDGAGVVFLRQWYALFRRHRPAPARVVLVLPWFVVQPKSGWRQLEHDAEFLGVGELARVAGRPEASWPLLLANAFPLVKHRERWLTGDPEPGWAAGLTFRATRGYAPYVVKKPSLARLERNFDLPADPAMVAATGTLLDVLRADRAAVAVVLVPTYRPSTPEHAACRAHVVRLATARGLPCFDYEADPRLAFDDDPAAFRDWAHLLAGPSERLSRLLAEDLRRVGFLAAGR